MGKYKPYDLTLLKKGDTITWYNPSLCVMRKGKITEIVADTIAGYLIPPLSEQKKFTLYDPDESHRITIISNKKI